MEASLLSKRMFWTVRRRTSKDMNKGREGDEEKWDDFDDDNCKMMTMASIKMNLRNGRRKHILCEGSYIVKSDEDGWSDEKNFVSSWKWMKRKSNRKYTTVVNTRKRILRNLDVGKRKAEER